MTAVHQKVVTTMPAPLSVLGYAVLLRCLRLGALFGLTAWYLSAVGLLGLLATRDVVIGMVSLGYAVLAALGLGAGWAATARMNNNIASMMYGMLAGAVFGAVTAALPIVITLISLRWIFIALSPDLARTLTFHLPLLDGVFVMVVMGAIAGLLGACLRPMPAALRRMLAVGVSAVLVAGVFQELLQIILQSSSVLSWLGDMLYTWEGLKPQGAAIILVVSALGSLFSPRRLFNMKAPEKVEDDASKDRKRILAAAVLFIVLMALPLIAGAYVGQVLVLVGLYILMGMGLNLELGLAGLLDLGFVAFFAVGAYVTALLTGDNSHAVAALSFWAAMPIAVGCAVVVGVLFGLPVLGVRGDYLAVATLGLGEIVRVLVASDFAAPMLGGAQGLLQIPPPNFFGTVLDGPVAIFYLTLAASIVAAYCAWRLETARLGRAWMALRDDEDVAQALGINLVRSKLLAYGLGAAFAGLAGAIFAAMVGSVYPSSFQLAISINVLALILVGGMGSLPGVIVGAAALIGMPELLREFGEFRFLFYGAALVLMTRLRPEGLWPSPVRRRELHSWDKSPASAAE